MSFDNEEVKGCALRKQVEFYFSDANLAKDRHMSKKIAEHDDGFVPVAHIASFNLVKRMCASTDDAVKVLVEALKHSDLLKLSDDESMVKRATPVSIVDPHLVDKRTVFVENLGEMNTHQKLHAHFGAVGEVVYISIPRFKESRKPKGYAFVEYSNTKDAKLALKQLNEFDPSCVDHQDGDSEPRLRVISKKYWRELRRQYVKRMKRLHYEELEANTANKLTATRDTAEPIETDGETTTQAEPVQHASATTTTKATTAATTTTTSGEPLDFESGVLVRVHDIDANANKSEIMQTLGVAVGTVRFVDHKRGYAQCIVRFYTKAQAQDLVDRRAMCACGSGEGGGGQGLTAALMEGRDELEYWKKIEATRAAKKAKMANREKRQGGTRNQGDSGEGKATAESKSASPQCDAAGRPDVKRPRNDFEAHGVVSHISFLSDDDDGNEEENTAKRPRVV